VSIQALKWALVDAPDVPQHCVSVLLALANHAGEDGMDAWPSIELMAWETRKSERQVQRALVELEDLDLIRRGDQRAAYKVEPRYRPVVYDLAMERHRDPYRSKRSRDRESWERDASRGDVDVVPQSNMQSNGSHDAHVVPQSARDDVGVEAGTTPTSYKPSTKPTTTHLSTELTYPGAEQDQNDEPSPSAAGNGAAAPAPWGTRTRSVGGPGYEAWKKAREALWPTQPPPANDEVSDTPGLHEQVQGR
jgi:Helix-turn-helix domain